MEIASGFMYSIYNTVPPRPLFFLEVFHYFPCVKMLRCIFSTRYILHGAAICLLQITSALLFETPCIHACIETNKTAADV